MMALELMGIDPGLRTCRESLLDVQDRIETETEVRVAQLKSIREEMIDNHDWDSGQDQEDMLDQVEALDRQVRQAEQVVREQQINRIRVKQPGEYDQDKHQAIRDKYRREGYLDRKRREYRRVDGLAVALEWLTGVDNTLQKVVLQYGVYRRGEQLQGSREIEARHRRPYTYDTSAILLSTYIQLYDLQAHPDSVLHFRLMGCGVKQSKALVGWTVLQLFSAGGLVLQGSFRVPFYDQSQSSQVLLDRLAVVPTKGHTMLYLKLDHHQGQHHSSVPERLPRLQDYLVPSIHHLGHPTQVEGRWLEGAGVFNRGLKRGLRKDKPKEDDDQLVVEKAPKTVIVEKERLIIAQQQIRKGLAVSIQGLKNYFESQEVQVKVALVENSKVLRNENNQPCAASTGPESASEVVKEASQRSDFVVSSDEMDSIVLMVDAHGQAEEYPSTPGSLWIDDHFVFFSDLYYYTDYHNAYGDMYLVFQVFSRNAAPLGQEQDKKEEPWQGVGWCLFPLFRDDHTLKEGRHHSLLAYPPIIKPPLPDTTLSLSDVFLDFTVEEYEYDVKGVGRAMRLLDRQRQERDERRKQRKVVRIHTKETLFDTRPFIPDLKRQWVDKAFEKGFGIDLYLDACRFLPDNVTVVKAELEVYDREHVRVVEKFSCVAEVNSPCYSPTLNLRQELRAPHFDPTLLIVISLVTYDRSDNSTHLVGYSAFPLFLNTSSLLPPTSPNDQQTVLQNGNYQLPIYCQEPLRKAPFTINSFSCLDRLPCSSLLIRVRQAPMTQDGLRALGQADQLTQQEALSLGVVVPSQDYGFGGYNTSYCKVTDTEKEVFKERQKRSDHPVSDEARKLHSSLLQLNPDYPLPPLDTAQDMAAFMNTQLVRHPNTPIIDLTYFSQYSPSIGFRFSVDGLHNSPEKQHPLVTLTSLSSSSFYASPSPVPPPVALNLTFNWDSPLSSPAYNEGYAKYRDVAHSSDAFLVVEVRKAVLSAKVESVKLEPVGWVVLPLFTPNRYVRSGHFQLPLIKGPVDPALLQALHGHEQVWDEFIRLVGQSKGKLKFMSQMSVLVRLLDGQRDGHLPQMFDPSRLSYQYLPQSHLSSAYTQAIKTKHKNAKKLITISPLKYKTTEFNNQIAKLVREYLQL